jgi:tungstate transport system permease protein
MGKALAKAFSLILSGDAYLMGIISTTLRMSLSSSAISLILGMPLGVALALARFPGKKAVYTLLRTLMGLPPVAVGIGIYILFSGTGPFGSLGLIYSVELMIIAQVVLITPIVAGMAEMYVSQISEQFLDSAKGVRLNRGKVFALAINESRFQMIAIYLFAFARAMAEVGAVQIVGGNILNKTRVMTTTIALNYNTGKFEYAVALGLILLFMVLIVNCVASLIQEKLK